MGTFAPPKLKGANSAQVLAKGKLTMVSGDNGRQCNLEFGGNYVIARKSRQPDSKPYVDHVAYTIETWDKKYVGDELRRRGLDPRPDTDESFHVKDPDGYDVQIASKKLMSLP